MNRRVPGIKLAWGLALLLATISMTHGVLGDAVTVWSRDEIAPPCRPLQVDSDKQNDLTQQNEAWQAFLAENGENWTVLWNEDNATPNTVLGEGLVLTTEPLTPELVENVSRQFLEENKGLFRLQAPQLKLERLVKGNGLWYVRFSQVHNGVTIFASRVELTISDAGLLLWLGSEWLFPEINISIAPLVGDKQAIEEVLRRIPFDTSSDRIDAELEIYPCSGDAVEPRLAWKVKASTDEPIKNWVFHIDAETGDVLHVWDGILYADIAGNVSGRGIRFDPFTNPTPVTLPMSAIGVGGSGGAFGFTAGNGNYNIFVVPNPATMVSDLGSGGLFSRIQNQAGANLNVSGSGPNPGPAINLLFNPAGAAEFNVAQVNAYFHANVVHDFLQSRIIPRVPGIDISIPTRVNLNQTCNAFYTGNTINFFRSGGGCLNSAYDTVIHHEYGHFLHDNIGGINNGALSEGIGDTVATFTSSSFLGVDQPLIGENFSGAGQHIRTGDNNRQWPASECGGEVHCVGEVYAGFTWHARRNMLNRGANVRVAEDLILNALLAHSPNIPAQVTQTFLTDRVRYGSPARGGSPDYYALCEAATAHGFNSSLPPTIPAWIDFGNAPDPPYPTRLASNGARHRVICAEWLGDTNEPLPSVDGEPDALLTPPDILNDGWTNYTGMLRRGVANAVNILVNTSGRRERRYNPANPARRLYLRAWADWNGNGSWNDPGELIVDRIVDPTTFPAGQKKQTFNFTVTPPNTSVANTWIRIRLSYGEVTNPVGATEFGEVEDYRVLVVP